MVKNMKMTVIGAGYVGISTALCFAHAGHETILLECDSERFSKLKSGNCPFYEPIAQEWLSELLESGMISVTDSPSQAIPFGDVIWIAVNTPARSDKLFDLSALESAISDILKYRTDDVTVVIKSTVVTGTCRKLLQQIRQIGTSIKINLVFSPEFLREGYAIQDLMSPSRVILGTEDGESPALIHKSYESLGIKSKLIVSTTFENAEVIKLASNSFLAIKLTYINELANYCQCVSADIDVVTYCMGLDERIAPGYMKSGIGYGGACLPKDTGALASHASQNNMPLTILEQAIFANETQINNAANTISKHMPTGGVLAVLGISFKPNSGDLRCSPALKILNFLITNHTYCIQLYEPYFNEDIIERIQLPKSVRICANMNEAIDNADGMVILTAHNQFRNIELKSLKELMHGHILFDFFDCYSDESANEVGLKRITKID